LHAMGNHGETEFVGRAEGSTKKDAEQAAAHQVLEHLASLPVDSANKVPGKGRP
jgi:dsRNA-specific ribonuclease